MRKKLAREGFSSVVRGRIRLAPVRASSDERVDMGLVSYRLVIFVDKTMVLTGLTVAHIGRRVRN